MASDSYLMYTLVLIFVILGAALPFVNEAANSDNTQDYNIDELTASVGQEVDSAEVSTVSALQLSTRALLNIFLIFFWSFEVGIWVNLILLEPFRVLLYYLIYRAIRGI